MHNTIKKLINFKCSIVGRFTYPFLYFQGNIVAYVSSILSSSFKNSDDCRSKQLSACSVILSCPFSLIPFTAPDTLTFFSFHSLLTHFSWQTLIVFFKSENVIFWVIDKILINNLFEFYISSIHFFPTYSSYHKKHIHLFFSKTRDHISFYSYTLCMIVFFFKFDEYWHNNQILLIIYHSHLTCN